MMQANQNSSRAAALARRKAMSSGGKKAVSGRTDRTRMAPERSKPEAPIKAPAAAPVAAPVSSPAPTYRPRVAAAPAANSSRSAALARRKAMSGKGKTAASSRDRTRDLTMVASSKKAVVTNETKTEKSGGCGCGCKGERRAQTAPAAPRANAGVKARSNLNSKVKVAVNPSKAAALARRKAQSTRGKAGLSAGGMTQAQTARATNPELSGRELAKALRDQRSTRGKAGEKKSRPTGRQRAKPEVGAAKDQPWKVGVSETARGQSVTGTMVGRDKDVTGDEASTCRAITGTEYMGADVFREFCQTEPAKTPMRSGVSQTGRGNAVTGNKVGRSSKVTGDEPGTCKNVTGTEYVGGGQFESFCGTAAKPAVSRMTASETRKGKTVTGDNVGSFKNVTGGEAGAQRELTGAQYMQSGEAGREPAKVRVSETLRGGKVTGTAVGRSTKTTGDEQGSCRKITGDDYVGQEQYQDFCGTKASPQDRKVGASATFNGMTVTGTLNGRSQRVTGNEPGTCKTITGTPYAGVEDYAGNCEVPATNSAAARMRRDHRGQAKSMTGLQPSVGGRMTGDSKGACENVTGTPYVGGEQMAQACPATAAEPSSPDFPQAVGDANGWGEFSVTPPVHAAAAQQHNTGVTGSQYEMGHITGPFGMAAGKVTGTEDARFGSGSIRPSSAMPEAAEEPAEIDGRVKARITGEGQDSGLRITGDDWDRGDRITGTEGFSAMSRNPSRRGGAMQNAMTLKSQAEEAKAIPQPVSKITGASGNYDGGSLITYSGGARG